MPEVIPMTKKGYNELKTELEHLKRVLRPQVIQAIAEARSHGDLSENAEYDAAKEKQGMIESKIRLLEHKMACARIIDQQNTDSTKVVFGKKVLLQDIKAGRDVQYTLVGAEADYKKGEISVSSPVGKRLLGHEVGEEISVSLPSREVKYRILKIE